MDAATAIRTAEAKAKREAIVERLLQWIEQAETVDIVRETPGMKPSDCSTTASMRCTGELTIELKLTGIDGIDAAVKPRGDHRNPEDWMVV